MLAGPAKSLAGLHRTYHELTGTALASSSFQERFCPAMVTWLRSVFEHAAATVAAEATPRMSGLLASFRELTPADSMMLRLDALLDPGCRTNHSPATAKLDVIHNHRGPPRSANCRMHPGGNQAV